jgi:hypothetical protein
MSFRLAIGVAVESAQTLVLGKAAAARSGRIALLARRR